MLLVGIQVAYILLQGGLTSRIDYLTLLELFLLLLLTQSLFLILIDLS